MKLRWMLSIVLILLIMSACSGTEANLTIVASSPTTIGVGVEQRVLLGIIDPDTNESLGSAERTATAEFIDPENGASQVAAEFLWTVPDVRGLYLALFTFDRPGVWSVRVHPDGLPPTPPTPFEVVGDISIPEVGERAPASITRTTADHTISEISTDPNPDPAFYEASLDAAIASGRPTVVVFATPGFCQSATCGPMLDIAKQVRPAHAGANFIHVEIFENLDAPSFDQLRPVAAVTEWGFISEPWVYVIDPKGVVTARFEGAYTAEELGSALISLGV
jgi:hypothetical protein